MSWSEQPADAARGAIGDAFGRARRRGLPPRAGGIAVLALLLAIATGLGGCGFRLRGDVSYAFSSIYVSGPPGAPIVADITRSLEQRGQTRVVGSPGEAQVILEITSTSDDKGVLSLSSGGRVREYLLTSRVAFNVHDAGGRDWLPAGEITLRRSYAFSESEVLAREVQEQRLLRDMRTDAVQQIIRRLQAAKKPAT